MKYCVDYKKNFKYLDQIDELNITYNRRDNSLIGFLQAYSNPHRRINIFIKDEQEFIDNDCISLFSAIVKKYKVNITLVLNSYNTDTAKEICKSLSEAKIPFFFKALVKSWDSLVGYKNLHPTDMYIVQELCFELDAVAKVLHQEKIKIRTFPNVGQTSWKETPALKKFFIRPEDVSVYEPYIDVLEFFGRPNSIETYYKVYAIEKKWFGLLNELIIDLDTDIDSRFLLPTFAGRRVNCGKRCLKGRPCRICEATEQLSAVLKENDLMIKTREPAQ